MAESSQNAPSSKTIHRKVVLVQKEIIHHYRVSIYNYFYKAFLRHGFELTVIAERVQPDSPHHIEFNLVACKLSVVKLKKHLYEIKPDIIIAFFRLKDTELLRLFLSRNLRRCPVLMWSHGIDLSQPHNLVKNLLYSMIHLLADGSILYSQDQLKYIPKSKQSRVFVANNTLNFDGFSKVTKTKEQVKREWDINYSRIVLFSGRIKPRKRLDGLIEIFRREDFTPFGLVIVGPGLLDKHKRVVKKSPNIYYLGPIYDENKVSELFHMADVFCTPGWLGLAINQAFYWGLPVVTEKGNHPPEICYLRDGINGYIAKDHIELMEKLLELLHNDALRSDFSRNARMTIMKEASIERMTEGFINAMETVSCIRQGN